VVLHRYQTLRLACNGSASGFPRVRYASGDQQTAWEGCTITSLVMIILCKLSHLVSMAAVTLYVSAATHIIGIFARFNARCHFRMFRTTCVRQQHAFIRMQRENCHPIVVYHTIRNGGFCKNQARGLQRVLSS